jgi:malate dehydrogenase (oxaloacetate-decarboxylating)(NADP+)
MSAIYAKTKKKLARIVFPEGDQPKILQAAQILRDDGICEPVLLGSVAAIRAAIAAQHLDGLEGVEIFDPLAPGADYERFAQRLWELRARKGVTREQARRKLRQRDYFAALMVEQGAADGMVSGLTTGYGEAIRAPFEVIGTRPGKRAAGVYIVITKHDFKFFADCTVNPEPTAEELAEIALMTADLARTFDTTPRVAMLSYSSFGGVKGQSPAKVRRATEILRRCPELEVDGEIQVDIATSSEVRRAEFPFSTLREDANVLIFPNLDSANIAYQLLANVGGAEVIGPILLGMARPVNVLQMGSSVQAIVSLAGMTALRAQGDHFTF